MKANKTLEFVWKGTGYGGGDGIFTHVYHQHYSFPKFLDPYKESKRCYNVPVQPEDYENW